MNARIDSIFRFLRLEPRRVKKVRMGLERDRKESLTFFEDIAFGNVVLYLLSRL